MGPWLDLVKCSVKTLFWVLFVLERDVRLFLVRVMTISSRRMLEGTSNYTK